MNHIKDTYSDFKQFYKDMWDMFNWTGRITLFLLLVICSPLFFIILLGFKRV